MHRSLSQATLVDLGESRLASMDENGITMQALSCPTIRCPHRMDGGFSVV
jgi:hypothetical protein